MDHIDSSTQSSGAPPQMSGPTSAWTWPPPPGIVSAPPMPSPPMSGPPPTWPPAQAPTFPPPATYPPPQATQQPPPPLPDAPFRFSPTPQPAAQQAQPPAPDIQASVPTTQSIAIDPALLSAELPTQTTPRRSPSPRRSGASKNWQITTGKTRKRRQKSKSKRKNRKNWADGVRETILRPYVSRYVEAVAEGGWVKGQEVIREVCAEYHAKIPWTLPYWVEPELPLPEYDPKNPPVLPRLSDEEEAERSAALSEINAAIHRWIHWRARKVPGYRQQYRANRNNPYDRSMLELAGMSPKGAKKALQPVQQFAKENPAVTAEAKRLFLEQKTNGGGVVQHLGKPATKKSVNWTMKYCKELFDKLPKAERDAYGARARAIAAQEKKAWEDALKEPPRRDAESLQTAWDCLDAFVEPLLRGLMKHLDGTVVLLISARVPENDGKPLMRHFTTGKNRDGLPIQAWEPQRFQDIIGTFMDYYDTVWTREQCAAVSAKAKGNEEVVGTLGRMNFTAAEVSDGEESDSEEEDSDGSDSDDETPLAAKNNTRGRQKKRKAQAPPAGNAQATPTASAPATVERTPAPARETSTPPPSEHEPPAAPLPHPLLKSPSPHSAREPSLPQPEPHTASSRPPEADVPPALEPRRTQQEPEDVPPQPQRGRKRPEPPHAADEEVPPSRRKRGRALTHPEHEQNTVSMMGSSNSQTSQPASATEPLSATSSTVTGHRALDVPHSAAGNPAAAWFCDAWKYVAHDYGADWAALLQEFISWEEAHGFNNAKGTKALPTLNTRPKEVASWISHARWNRGHSGEPAPKSPALSQRLLRGWWEWYRRLSPAWRSTRPDGTLEPIVDIQDDMGKLECSGINGILNLIVVLKWAKEGLLSGAGKDVEKLEANWVGAVRDLHTMLHAMVEQQRKATH